jgi:hypothetical protein
MNPRFLLSLAALTLAACQPPPTDAAEARVAGLPAGSGPSDPLPSPDTTGAIWAAAGGAAEAPMRLVYGVPGQPVLVALECLGAATPAARLQITRNAPADKDAGALLALIGNREVARVPVDATPQGNTSVWQGAASAQLSGWDALADPENATITVPGAGMVTLNPSPLPVGLVTACRGLGRGPELPAPPEDPASAPVAIAPAL